MQLKSVWWMVSWALYMALATAGAQSGAGQSGHKVQPLSVNGHTGEAIVYQIDGKSYVDLQNLVRIANGSITFKGDQIILSFPSSEEAASGADPHAPESTILSPDFMRAGVQELALLKDWVSKLAYALQHAHPGDGSRVVILHDRALEGLHLAKVSATSNSDQNALQLLTTHFNNVGAWSDKLIGERKRADTAKYSMSPDALKNDEHYQKIMKCMQSLNSMVSGGTFHDDYACH